MKKPLKSRRHAVRQHTLSAVGMAVAATLLVGAAHAAETTIDAETAVASTAGHKTAHSVQTNVAGVASDASLQNILVTGTGPQAGSSHLNSLNLIGAYGTGNSFAHLIDLSLTANLPLDGAAALGWSKNSGLVVGDANDNLVMIELDGFTTGTAAVTGNSISAVTALNAGSSRIAGTVPNGYSSATAGSTSIGQGLEGGIAVEAVGSIVVSSVQQATGPGSRAHAGDNEISLNLTSTTHITVASAPVLNNNTLAATFRGNTATSTADLQAGGAPSFTGSAVVSNVQLNEGLDTVQSATAQGTRVVADVYSTGVGTVATLQGALSVRGNQVTSAATGNESLGTGAIAGNRILLGDGLSFMGSGGAASNSSNGSSSAPTVGVSADLAIVSSQRNVGVGSSALTGDTAIVASVQSLSGGSIVVADNGATASATGNAASSAVASGLGAASFVGTAAIANQQGLVDANVQSTGRDTLVAGFAQTVVDSSISLADNRSVATATGNQSRQSLALDAVSLVLGNATTLSGNATSGGSVSAAGAATISNAQGRINSGVSAENAQSTLLVQVGASSPVSGSTLSLAANTQEAVALGNSAANSLLLAGNAVGTGAGIANVQSGDSVSTVNASLTGALAGLVAQSNVVDSSLALNNNLQRAIGYGNSAANALTVTANSVGMASGAGAASVMSTGTIASGTVSAGLGVLNNQLVQAGVDALIPTTSGSGLSISAAGHVLDSTVAQDGNALVAAAYGNDAANQLTLVLGSGVNTGPLATSVANVSNAQSVAGNETRIAASAEGSSVVLTDIAGAVTNSSLSMSGNQIQALAYGSRASANTLDVTGNELSAFGLGQATAGGGTATVNASFSVQNVQSSQGLVLATQRTHDSSAAQMRTEIGGAVSAATVMAQGNSSTASATSNSASNALFLTANTVASNGALQNVQWTSAGVQAEIGQAGLAGSPFVPGGAFNYGVGGSSVNGTYDSESDTWLVSAGNLTVDASAFTAAQITYLTSNEWVSAGDGQYTRSAIGMTLSPLRYGALSEGGTATFSGATASQPLTLATANQGGVTVAVGSSVSASMLSVKGNSTSGSVAGNSASNSSLVTANTLTTGSTAAVTQAGTTFSGVQHADHALSNRQSAMGAPLTSSVFGSFAIEATPGAAISGSTLDVSGNSQRASAVANTAVNAVTLAGSHVAATAALASHQEGVAAVSALSDLAMFAPGAVTGSSISFSDNRNTALGVSNDVANTLTVSGSNISSVAAAGMATAQATAVSGDHVLTSYQQAVMDVTSTAVTRVHNQDEAATASTGLVSSSLTMSGNQTAAEASANRAANSLVLNAAATLGASAGIGNTQSNMAITSAVASSSGTFRLQGDVEGEPLAALTQGTVLFNGNITTALARGNMSANTLEVSAGGGYTAAGDLPSGSTAQTVTATAAVLNSQSNFGGVSASSTATYQVALNALVGAAVPGSLNSAVSVIGNVSAAEAYGNTSTNRVVVAALNTGTPTAAVANHQSNFGGIVATTTSVNYSIDMSGASTGNSLRASGNQINATAVGNSAVSSIIGR